MVNEYGTGGSIPSDTPTQSDNVSNDDVISTLNGLIETCKDGQKGFKEAAEGVERSDLKTLFYEFSQQRAEFAGVLQELVRSMGGDPENSGSMAGAVHRGWIDLKSAITGKDDGAILNECERGEDSAKDAYAEALESSLPANVEDVVRQQSQAVLAAHNRVRSLRNAESRTANTGS
jgi:uncharacterized protein (TIGR02284 family)